MRRVAGRRTVEFAERRGAWTSLRRSSLLRCCEVHARGQQPGWEHCLLSRHAAGAPETMKIWSGLASRCRAAPETLPTRPAFAGNAAQACSPGDRHELGAGGNRDRARSGRADRLRRGVAGRRPCRADAVFRIHQTIYIELYAGVALVLAGLQAAAITSFCSLSPTPWRSILLRAVVFGAALSALAVEASSAADLPDCLNREKNFCVLHSPASEPFAPVAALLVSQALSAFGLLAALPVAAAVMKRRAYRHDG